MERQGASKQLVPSKPPTSCLQLLAASQGAHGSGLITRAGCPDQPAAELGAPQRSSPCPCPMFVLRGRSAGLGDPSHLCQGATAASHCPPGSQQKTEDKTARPKPRSQMGLQDPRSQRSEERDLSKKV